VVAGVPVYGTVAAASVNIVFGAAGLDVHTPCAKTGAT
jgi:hypothetical protein